MPSPLRVLDTWFTLHLTVGILTAITVKALSTATNRVALFVGAFVALLSAVGLLYADPELDVGSLWRIGYVALGVTIVAGVGGMATGTNWPGGVEGGYPLAVGFGVLADIAFRRR